MSSPSSSSSSSSSTTPRTKVVRLSTDEDVEKATSAYDFVVLDADYNIYDLSSQRRGVGPTLFFNSASQCGLAKSSFESAHKLHQKYKEHGFLPISFPSATFYQEPLSGPEAKKHSCSTHQIEFPIMAKVEVNGSAACPLWKYLQKEKTGFMFTAFIKWNFTSFLVDENGKVVQRFSPGMSFEDIENALVPLLKDKIVAGIRKKESEVTSVKRIEVVDVVSTSHETSMNNNSNNDQPKVEEETEQVKAVVVQTKSAPSNDENVQKQQPEAEVEHVVHSSSLEVDDVEEEEIEA